jgi:hypothetical protein
VQDNNPCERGSHIIKIERDGFDNPSLTTDNLLAIVETNRSRIRTLSSLVVTVCGFLLSACFVVLFFILKDPALKTGNTAAPNLLLASVGSLVVAILLSVYSVLATKPEAVRTKLQLLDLMGSAYYRERKRVLLAMIFLFVGVAMFVSSMALFSFQAVR